MPPLRRAARLLLLALGMSALGSPTPASAQEVDPVGDWTGALSVSGVSLRIVFHVAAGEGGLSATMDSPDQGALGIPTGSVEVVGDSLIISVPAVGGGYRGRIDGDALTGRWSQGGQSLPLDLARGEAAGAPPAPVRPQHPEPPYPYGVEEVRFANAGAGIELAGTLTTPPGDGPFPGVVLVSGSGPQTRDEVVAGHRIFHVLADHLTRRGIAVLRYDDRGVGESGGDFSAATSRDFASDAAAAVAFLRTRSTVDGGALGVVGHSEGGLVAPMVAAADPQLAFVVLLAGPGVDGTEILVSQTAAMQRRSGVPAAQVEANERAIRAVAGILTTRPEAVWTDEVRAALLESVPAGATAEQARAAVDPQVASFANPWMAFFVGYDPVPALESLEIPVLALNGSLDLQVLADVNLPPLRAALGERPGVTVEELPGLNHLFQPAGTGMPTEYGTIETTFDPAALERVSTWILEVGAAGGG